MASVALAGCTSTLAPEYVRPEAMTPDVWPQFPTTADEMQHADAVRWDDLFSNSKLRQIVQKALDNNQDLITATLNVEKAKAQFQIQRSELTPKIGLEVSGESGRIPGSISDTGEPYTSHTYQAGLGVTSWEVDLFGRIRSLENQAKHDFMATEAAQRAAKLSLIAEVALTYVKLAADSEQLNVSQETIQRLKEAYELQADLQSTGTTSALELNQALGELEASRDDALSLESVVASDKSALELLVGTSLDADLLKTQPIKSILPTSHISAGLPSDLLRNRPDIYAAEQYLIGANANIGAARAAFFPSISLTGGFGRASNSLDNLFSGVNRTWSVLPQVNIPIFTGGQLSSALKVAEVDRDLAIARYQKSIQVAFKEVSDGLAVRSKIDDRLAAQQARLVAAEQAYALIKQRYESGITRYLEVIDAQRTLYTAQRSMISTQLIKHENSILMFKALGGDWRAQSNARVAAVR
ncbi:efflux transporter outer membrane subunit [Pseudomonas putida]